ncbi:MAG: hypothetical protein HFP81_09205 [Methylococcales symbiont of Hymedesmia sp. n. MRB-2018]|nr:MAG: hypothetical protein HFP78_09000 [Methylococcales symbiont of Hymedesmia sp. n. MRB-2018]KAF3983135.1 MAG: hypothetical protein HFP81_09205 [Methylococcales symbiont of Hymedesmia sp. n. MRB-2018]
MRCKGLGQAVLVCVHFKPDVYKWKNKIAKDVRKALKEYTKDLQVSDQE